VGLKEKNDVGPIGNNESTPMDVKLKEASHFLHQFSQDTELVQGRQLEERLEQIKIDITRCGTYVHSFDEIEYGCRLAWRNSGRCIMRNAFSTLEVRDCRQVTTAEECFNQCVWHLKDAFNGGSVTPVISVFKPKADGESAPVRIWNRELLGYAAHRRSDGTIMGDPANLEFTSLCMKFGWTPPEEKSDFDILPWLISDKSIGHENPKVFNVPNEAIEEVELVHPDFDLFGKLNLRWYALPCYSNIGVDIGGKMTAAFILVLFDSGS
jgi:nitric-oxide synthase